MKIGDEQRKKIEVEENESLFCQHQELNSA
jgi:hypothetical protein